MVSTIRFRSFKTIDLRSRRPYTVLLLVAGALVLIATEPRWVLVAMAYSYLASAFIGMALTRLRTKDGPKDGDKSEQPSDSSRTPAAS
jgi:phosphatidylserine synthase